MTSPDATIAISHHFVSPSDGLSNARTFTITPDTSGAWSFDLRSLGEERVGTREYEVWAFTDEESSVVETGTYELTAPIMSGIENFTLLGIDEAADSGLVIRFAGTPETSLCLISPFSNQYLEIPLDASGSAVRRMRMLEGGFYWLNLRQCDTVLPSAMYRGPASEFSVEVEDPDMPIFGPWGPEEQGVESIVLEPVE